MLKVKICGITSAADARLAAAAGADAIGLNFSPRSVRRVSVDMAAAIAAVLPPHVCRVGVFTDAPRDEVLTIIQRVGLDALQFHGGESAAACAGWTCKTIKAIRVRDAGSLARAADFAVDWILADAYVEGQLGGTGKRVPTDWLSGVPRERLIVAGGLTAETVAALVTEVRPGGVDVASGVERAPGVKDPEKVRAFVDNAKSA